MDGRNTPRGLIVTGDEVNCSRRKIGSEKKRCGKCMGLKLAVRDFVARNVSFKTRALDRRSIPNTGTRTIAGEPNTLG